MSRPIYHNPYDFAPTDARLRSWDVVPVPALSNKRSGKTVYKRVKRAYPTTRRAVGSTEPPAAKRLCTLPPILREKRDHGYLDTGVKNPGFWDKLSAKGWLSKSPMPIWEC